MAFSIKTTVEVPYKDLDSVLSSYTAGCQSVPYRVGDIITFGPKPKVFEVKADVNGREVSYFVVQADHVTRGGIEVPPINPFEGHRVSLNTFCSRYGCVIDINNTYPHIEGRFPANTAGAFVYRGIVNQSFTFNEVRYRVETARGIEERRLTAWR